MIRLRRTTETMSAGVLPTLAALVTMALMLIEGRQVDWAADCAVPDVCTKVVEKTGIIPILGLVPLFVFALGHILGSRHIGAHAVQGPARIVRAALYAAVGIVPSLGWYFIYAGVAAGFLALATIILMPVAPLVGVLGSGFAAGTVLAFAAGPAYRSTPWSTWRRRVGRYGLAATIAAPLYVGGYMMSPAHFLEEQSWATTAIVFTATAVACAFVCIAAFGGAALSGRTWKQSAIVVVAAIAAFTGLVEAMAANGATVFARRSGPFAIVAEFLRDHRPPRSDAITFAGLTYVGSRSQIRERGSAGRQRLVNERRNVGTPQEVTASWTVTDRIPMWRITAPRADRELFYLYADGGGVEHTLSCRLERADREICVSASHVRLARATEQHRHLAMGNDDSYEFDPALPNASLGIRLHAKSLVEDNPAAWTRIYCRLSLINVTPARVSVHQIIPCEADWPSEARALRSHVESLFVTRAMSGSSGKKEP